MKRWFLRAFPKPKKLRGFLVGGFVLDFGAFSLGYKKDRLNNANFYLNCKNAFECFLWLTLEVKKLCLVKKVKKV